jgi:hypothetical protein
MKRVFIVTTALLIIGVFLVAGIILNRYDFSKSTETPKAFVGITYGGNSVAQGEALIDKVKGYTNLFVLASGLLERDFKSVDELGDYAVSAGMYFLPYFGNYIQSSFAPWLEEAKQKWGTHLLGVYYGDEPGGKMLDDYVEYQDLATGDSITKTKYGDIVVQKTDGIVINYALSGVIQLYEPALANSGSDIDSEAAFYPNGTIDVVKPAANGFSFDSYQELESLRPFKDLNDTAQRFYDRDKNSIDFLKNSTKVFTSDYALYQFDYSSGYDVVLGQIGWNLSLNQQLSLMRGAANLEHKDWGIVITWKYQGPDLYLDNGTEILNQMRTAYDCGAKYFVLFDYYDSDNSTYGTLKPEHFQALQTFWNDVVKNPNVVQGSIKADSVLVMPQNYGWGTRWQQDHIWGIFNANETTAKIWNLMQTTLQEHGLKIDIVCDDPEFPLPAGIKIRLLFIPCQE